MIVRKANKFDIPYFIETVHKARILEHNGYSNDIVLDDSYLNSLFTLMINGGGLVLVAESEKPIGICAGYINASIWHKNTFVLWHALIYVEEEWRNTRAGYKLIKEYNNEANNLMKEKRIYTHTFSTSKPLFNIDMEKFNYKLTEKLWIAGE
jgi:hypothetical protein